MLGLRELQQAFGSSLRSEDVSDIAAWVCANELNGTRRIQIYRNNLFVTLTDALRAVYPVLEKLVGDGFFRFAAHEFIHRYPSHQGNLHRFGHEFAKFLGDFAPAQGHAYLPDVAQLEWAQHEVYHAAEHAPLEPRALTAIDADRYESLRFNLHPARRLLRSTYPVVRIWEVNQPDFDGDQTVDLSVPGDCVLVLRINGEIEFHSLAPAEYRFLATISKGNTLGQAVAAALEVDRDFDLNHCLVKHVQNHTLVKFNLT
jgi:hypothetical protein